jgi:hypothetical protein
MPNNLRKVNTTLVEHYHLQGWPNRNGTDMVLPNFPELKVKHPSVE